MKKNLFLIIGLSVLLTVQSTAQNPYKGEVSVDVSIYAKQSDKVIINADVILDKLTLPGNSMIAITPVLRSLDGTDQIEFEPLIINGSIRNKANLRAATFGDYNYPENTAGIIKRRNGKAQRFAFSSETDYLP